VDFTLHAPDAWRPVPGSSPLPVATTARLRIADVLGDAMLSRTRLFIRRHSVALSTTVNSLILNPLMVNIGSHEDLTSGRQGQRAKAAELAKNF